MLTKEEFGGAAKAFMDQLSAFCLQQSGASLNALPGFDEEVSETIGQIKDASAFPDRVLSAACGLVHEFTNRDWERVLDATYSHYKFVNRADEWRSQRGR